MNTEKLRSLIRESIQDYIKEIDIAANEAAMEARINKCEEAIQMRETKLSAISESDHKDLMDEGKIKMMEKEITELKKAKAKFEKQKEKMLSKGKKKEEVKDETITEEAPIDEMDVTTEMDLEEAKKKNKKDEKEMMNESFLKMQKLAGVITEAQMREKLQKLNENMETKPYDALLNKVKQYEGFEDYVGSFKKFFQGKNTITKDEWMKWSGTIDGGYDPEDLASEIWNQS